MVEQVERECVIDTFVPAQTSTLLWLQMWHLGKYGLLLVWLRVVESVSTGQREHSLCDLLGRSVGEWCAQVTQLTTLGNTPCGQSS